MYDFPESMKRPRIRKFSSLPKGREEVNGEVVPTVSQEEYDPSLTPPSNRSFLLINYSIIKNSF